MEGHRRFMPVTTGLIVGLGWGLFVALLDGLPLLLQGSPWAYLGSRLLALALMAVAYGLLGAAVGALVGVLALVVLWVARRRLPRARLASGYGGLFAAVVVLIFWGQRFKPEGAAWLIVGVLSLGVGLGARWLLDRAARGGVVSWPLFRAAALGLFGVAAALVLVAAGYQTWLRDLPLFNPPATQETATAEQPNIVLITASGLRPDHLGINGYDPEISPNIDALAWQGVRFEQAISPASWTEPSLASLLTGLYPGELGIACRAGLDCMPHLDEARLTLAESVKEPGYHTQAFLTSPWLSAELGFAQGFDEFETNRREEPFDLGSIRGRTLGRLLGCDGGGGACRLLTQAHELLFEPPIAYGWGGGQINDRATRFLDLHGEERFFLWLHYTEALPAYDLEPPFRPILEDSMASPQRSLKKLGYWELGDPFTPREKLLPKDGDGLVSLYDGEVHRVDRMVGEFMGRLQERGLADRTLVVFTADHGQEFMEHGSYTYGHSLYDEVLHVPLILAGPGVTSPGGLTVETLVSTLDLAPTLAEMAGASILPESGGRSLVAALKGEALEAVPVYGESLYRVPHESKALYQDGYKLIHTVVDGRFELYDLAKDPAEQQDVLAQFPQVAEAMIDTLLTWMAHVEQVAEELPRAAPREQYDAWSW